MRGRIKAELSNTVCEYLLRPAIAEENKRSFYNMADINLAHVLMLMSQRIVSRDDGIKLLKTLWEMRADGPDSIEIHPEYEDYYFNIEKAVIAKIGMNIGGQMHTARSRNDLGSTLLRMNVRDALVQVISMAIRLEEVLLKIAEENGDAILTGYTHMQPAQPISLSYYLCAFSQALERDIQRLQAALERMNYCTLGACAFAGTSFPVDRESVARDLGFAGPSYNGMDAIVSRDYLQEIAAAYTILGTNISRFAADFYYWCTDEFGYFEVDDSYAVCSSIMPQKKNPTTLEHVRAKSAHLLGAFTSITMALKGVAFGHNRDVAGEAPHLFWDASEQMVASLALLTGTMETMHVHRDKMEARVNANFCTVTELADELARAEGLPFRIAHEIVAGVVGHCVEKGLTTLDINMALINRFSREYAGREISWSDEKLRGTLDAHNSVRGKISYGGPGEEQRARMIQTLRETLTADAQRHFRDIGYIANAREQLSKKVMEAIDS